MAGPGPIPDPLRERLLQQQRRVRVVRVTFALTFALALALFLGAAVVQTYSPTLRLAGIILLDVKDPAAPDALLIEESIESVQPEISGTFRLGLMRAGRVTQGSEFSGVPGALALKGESRALVIFDAHYLEYDLQGNPAQAGWPKLVTRGNLGINESNASPVVASLDGVDWLCWVRGTEIRLRPLTETEVEPALVHSTLRRGASLDLVAAEGRLWLTVLEKTSGQLKLISFKPHLGERQAEAPRDLDRDAVPEKDAPAPAMVRVAQIDGLITSDVRKEVRTASLAILQGKPVIALSMREKERTQDSWEVWRMDDSRNWIEQPKPSFKSASLLSMAGYVSLSAHGGHLAALYSDGGSIRLSMAQAADKVVFGEAVDLDLGRGRGFGPFVTWLVGLLILAVLLAAQGVWLLLNRSPELDKTLAKLLEKPGEDKSKPKGEPLVLASQLGRLFALLIDLAVTSPAVILLKSVYGYEWSQAYSFFMLGSVGAPWPHVLEAMQAGLVTLAILALYGILCEMFWGKTFGKALLHLRVVNTDGEEPAAWQIVLRNLLRIVEMAHWALLFVPIAMMALTGRQQRLGDYLARTLVIVEVVPEDQADDLEI